MKDTAERGLVLSGLFFLGGLVFFLYTFFLCLNYQPPSVEVTTGTGNVPAVLGGFGQGLAVKQVIIKENPFYRPLVAHAPQESFPVLAYRGLIAGERILAIIEEVGGGNSWIVQVGDEVVGAKVTVITAKHLELSRSGQPIVLKMQEGLFNHEEQGG